MRLPITASKGEPTLPHMQQAHISAFRLPQASLGRLNGNIPLETRSGSAAPSRVAGCHAQQGPQMLALPCVRCPSA
eukprot:333746-Pelagomonas_calceolata.AAC.4